MTAIEMSDDHATVAVHTETTTYALRLDAQEGNVHPVYWGARLGVEDAAALPTGISPHGDTFEAPWDAAEDYPCEGGRTFGPVALGASFPDGTAGLDMRIVSQEIRDGELVVTLADRHQPLAVDLHYRPAAGTDVIERWSVVRH